MLNNNHLYILMQILQKKFIILSNILMVKYKYMIIIDLQVIQKKN